jgi:pimeloyl-ACP methyl ester carboxylesterase
MEATAASSRGYRKGPDGPGRRSRAALLAALAAGALGTAALAASGDASAEPSGSRGGDVVSMRPRDGELARPTHTRTWRIAYRAHTGRTRLAFVLLPSWYGPARHPSIPLVISPHGRGTSGLTNLRLWGDLPGIGGFAVVNPDGEGDHLGAFSWGAPGQIEDLARMPAVVRGALPWLRIDPSRVYAVGGSMGGQETLLLLARHPRLLAGAAAFDAVTDFGHQYRVFGRVACNSACRARLGEPFGAVLQRLARSEVGGDPRTAPSAYAARSPLTYAASIAASCVPLQLWWTRRDRIVVDPQRQSGRLLATVRRLNPLAPVEGIEGTWVHSAEMRARTRLPYALARFGLLPAAFDGAWALFGARVSPAPSPSCSSV